jgi:uncharacterized repeat protein (TIGR03803 family)
MAKTLALAVTLALAAAPVAVASSKSRVLYNFTGGSDGGNPILFAALAMDAHGNLYGATYYGGTACGGEGCGVIFEVARSAGGKWSEKVLFDITDFRTQGSFDSPLTADGERDLYGCSTEAPTFELTPESPLWDFNPIWQSPCAGGVGLILDSAGNLFGDVGLGAYGEGAISELSPGSSGWTLTELYSFCSKSGCPDGDYPVAPFSWDSKGNLYGTTYDGGYPYPKCYCGVAFQMTPNGDGTWTYHVLHRFTHGNDGGFPLGSVTVDASGAVYGTTTHGGPYSNGNVFKLTPTKDGRWKLAVVYGFPDANDGLAPSGDLVFDKAGNLYGTAGSPACNGGCGVIFKLSPQPTGKWNYSVLHRFNMTDGDYPNGLTRDGEGNLFGTTRGGGKYGYGVVFEITP